MMIPFNRASRLLLILIALVAVMSLAACSGVGGATTEPPSPEATTEPTATPEPPTVPPPTATPTEEPTEKPTETEPPVTGVITSKNAADVVEVRTINPESSSVFGLSFSPLDHSLATFGSGRSIDIWDVDTGKRIHHLGNSADYGFGLAFSPDGKKVVSGSTGGDVVIWDAVKGKKLSTAQQAPPSNVYEIAWSPDGDRFAVVGDESSRLAIFAASGNKVQEIKSPGGWFWGVAWSKDFLVASNDSTGKTYIYDGETYGNLEELAIEHPAHALDFSPDGKLLVTCLRTDGSLHVWDTSDWTEVTSWDAHPPLGRAFGCLSGAFSSDGSVYFSGGDEGNMIAWDIETGDRLKTFEYGVRVWSMTMSTDGTLLAVGLDDGQVKIIGLK